MSSKYEEIIGTNLYSKIGEALQKRFAPNTEIAKDLYPSTKAEKRKTKLQALKPGELLRAHWDEAESFNKISSLSEKYSTNAINDNVPQNKLTRYLQGTAIGALGELFTFVLPVALIGSEYFGDKPEQVDAAGIFVYSCLIGISAFNRYLITYKNKKQNSFNKMLSSEIENIIEKEIK